MKNSLLIWVFVFCSSCGMQERELELKQRTEDLNRREQELLVKERSLQVKSEELSLREKLLDSTSNKQVDSFFIQHPQLPGKWNVDMRCTETTCSGSAVGDTKNEQWEISYEGAVIVAKAFADNKLVRSYTGNHSGNTVELSTVQENPNPALTTTMIVRFQEIAGNTIRGQREILRSDQCHILYSLELTKQQ